MKKQYEISATLNFMDLHFFVNEKDAVKTVLKLYDMGATNLTIDPPEEKITNEILSSL